jgi:hypothetical protein
MADYSRQYRQFFNSLSQKQFDIESDPELAALHMKASRHFGAATKYYNDEGFNANAQYELEAAEKALENFNYWNEEMQKAPKTDELQ